MCIITSVDISYVITRRRKEMGLTQMELCQRSGVSLPTIQNIEGGKGNPSLQTLGALGDVLGLEITYRRYNPNWTELVACGLALVDDKAKAILPTENMLVRNLNRAFVEGPVDERVKDSLRAMVLALQIYYPLLFQKWFSKNKLVKEFQVKEPSGKLIKLTRISRAKLGEYL